MSLLFRKPVEARAVSFQSWWGAGQSDPRGDTLGNALSLIPVYAATSFIADQIAATPWAAFEKSAGIPVRVVEQPKFVSDPGVNRLDLFSWKFQLVTSLLLQGNAYGFIVDVDRAGMPAKVVWLRPDRVKVDESGPSPVFSYNGAVIDRSMLIHVPWYVVPGSVVGLSPISVFRTQIETGIEAQKASKNFFKRGGVPSAILKNDVKSLTASEAQESKRRFIASVSSSEPFVTGKDWSYESIALPAADASFLAGIKATATQVAAIYRVAPEDIGGETSGSSLTYKSLEQDQIRANTRTLRPVASRIESVFSPYLLNDRYLRFNLDASVRADLKTRYEAHQIAINAKFETRDEVRALEERGPLTSADIAQFKELDNNAPAIGVTP